MNPGYAFLMIQPLILLAFLRAGWRWSPAFSASERNAAKLLAANPGAEQCNEIFPLQSHGSLGKQCEIDGRIRDMQGKGWTYLKMSEVSPWISLRSWGGAVRLHFFRSTTQAISIAK
jgi:hypothetical protein